MRIAACWLAASGSSPAHHRVCHRVPPAPRTVTMMRNALGKEEGGSGVPLEREKYTESVAFWSKYASIK